MGRQNLPQGMQRSGTNQTCTTNARTPPQRNPPSPTVEPLTYLQVVQTVTFQDDDLYFSLTALSVGGAGPSPPSKAGAAQATPELTENETAPPKSSTTTSLEGDNRILNLNLPMGLRYQEIPADTDSDITLADSSVANDDNSTYLESRKISPAILNTTIDVLTIIKETGNILDLFSKGIKDPITPRVLFNQDNDLEPTDLLEEEATQTEPPLDNGGTTPLLNQPPSKYLSQFNNPDAPDPPPPGFQEDTSEAAHLASMENLPGKSLTAAD